jgi:hypothetical protein
MEYVGWYHVYHEIGNQEGLDNIRKIFYTPTLLLNYAKRNWKEGIDYFYSGKRWYYSKFELYRFELQKTKETLQKDKK